MNWLNKSKACWLILGWLALASLITSVARAAEWGITGNLNQSIGYDDNVFMSTERQALSSFKYMITPVLNFSRKTEPFDINASASYGTQIYTDIDPRRGLDQDFQNYNLNTMWRTSRFDLVFDFRYSVIPTRNTATQDSANFGSNTNTTWAIAPIATYKLSAVDNLILRPTYSETSFGRNTAGLTPANDPFNIFRDRTSFNIDLDWQHFWQENYSTTASFFYNTVQSVNSNNANLANNANNGFAFDSYGFNFTNDYKYSDRWKLLGTLGVRYTEADQNRTKRNSFGFLADITADYTGENYTAGINFTRALFPTSQGQLQELTSVGVGFTYQFTEHLSSALSMTYQDSILISQFNQNERENITVQPSINWRLAPDWTLSGSYRYRSQDGTFGVATTPTFAESNLFLLSINYNWQGFQWSR